MSAAGSVGSEESLLTKPRIASLLPAFPPALGTPGRSAVAAPRRHPIGRRAGKRARRRPRHFQALTRLWAWRFDPRRDLRPWTLGSGCRHLQAWTLSSRHRHLRAWALAPRRRRLGLWG